MHQPKHTTPERHPPTQPSKNDEIKPQRRQNLSRTEGATMRRQRDSRIRQRNEAVHSSFARNRIPLLHPYPQSSSLAIRRGPLAEQRERVMMELETRARQRKKGLERSLGRRETRNDEKRARRGFGSSF